MSVTARLIELISFDTQNPAGRERPLVDALARELAALGAAQLRVADVGDHAMVYARFGAGPPRLLVNAHVDTVPANAGYARPPLEGLERDGRLYGLGSSDTKGAIAAILEALALARQAGHAPEGLAVLFSGDEERAGTCMRHFLADRAISGGLTQAIVCEPTGNAVGWRHRGIAAAEATTTSPGGHSSRVDHVPNPIAILARAAVALDDLGRRYRRQGPAGFEGICLNVAALDGGLAFNVIPSRATLRVSLRPAPGADMRGLLGEAEATARAAAAPHQLDWAVVNENPTFQTRAPESFVPMLGERARQPIDLGFWTEAALLSAAGVDAVVFGPGRIEQAHAADEFVAIEELEAARDTFARLFSRGVPPS